MTTGATDADELQRLRDENARLRSLLASSPSSSASPTPDPPRRAHRLAWAIPSAALIVIGAVLAPVAVVGSWAGRELSSTDSFVATFAPLARDSAVQTFIGNETIAVVDQHLDVKDLTSTVFDGLGSLDLPPRASTALQALQAPAAAGLEDLVHNTVRRFVASDAFATLWDQLLRTGHTQLVASLSGDRKAAVAIAEDGSIGVQLGPVVAAVKQQLVDRGITLASRIPDVDRTIVIATSDAAVRAQTAYTLVQLTAAWLPWLAVACIGIGVLMARRRARALALAAVGVAVAMLLTLIALGAARVLTVRALAPDLMPRNAARAIYDAVVVFATSAAVATTVLALAVALVAWLAGSSTPAVRTRSAWRRVAGSARSAGDARGVTTGAVGEGVYRLRVLLRAAVAVGAGVLIGLHRPLDPALIVWTLVGALVAVALIDLLGRPPVAAGSDPAPEGGR